MKRGPQLEHQIRAKYHADIDGYRLTAHAIRCMIERGIHAKWVSATLNYPESNQRTRNGCNKIRGALATCVVNQYTREIVTVGYGALNDDREMSMT